MPDSELSSPSGPSRSFATVVTATLAILAVIAGAAFLLGRGDDTAPAAELDPRIAEIIEDESLASPLNFLLGIEDDQVDFAAMETRAQNTIAECMAEKGFVYIPVVDFPEGPEQLSGTLGEPPPLEQVERIGFGIVSSIEYEFSDEAAESRAMPDPNDEIRAGLSPEQLAEYERALSGFSMADFELLDADATASASEADTGSSADDYRDLASEGCLYQAYYDDSVAPRELVTEMLFSDAFADLQEAIQSDPAVVELETDWAACMASEGYQYETYQAAISDIHRRADAILAHASLDGLHPSSPHIANELAQPKSQEIETALANWTCEQGLPERFLKISRRHEIDFIQANESQTLAILSERKPNDENSK